MARTNRDVEEFLNEGGYVTAEEVRHAAGLIEDTMGDILCKLGEAITPYQEELIRGLEDICNQIGDKEKTNA